MNRIKEKILNNSISLYEVKEVFQHIYNDGLNKGNLEIHKQNMLKNLINEYTDIIETTEKYPENDIQKILLEIDAVLITRKQLDKILKDE